MDIVRKPTRTTKQAFEENFANAQAAIRTWWNDEEKPQAA
jgi:hypothetical protein